jgi:hypothetical protein
MENVFNKNKFINFPLFLQVVMEGTDPQSIPFEDPNKIHLVQQVSLKVLSTILF